MHLPLSDEQLIQLLKAIGAVIVTPIVYFLGRILIEKLFEKVIERWFDKKTEDEITKDGLLRDQIRLIKETTDAYHERTTMLFDTTKVALESHTEALGMARTEIKHYVAMIESSEKKMFDTMTELRKYFQFFHQRLSATEKKVEVHETEIQNLGKVIKKP